MEFRHQTLDNGLEVVAEVSPRTYSTAIGFFVRAGSRDETDDVAGVSHFLEHMMFKGTPGRSAADVNRELDEMGSQSNACTGEEQTVYYGTVLPEFQDTAVELFADIMRPSLRENDFDVEKKVIIEEIRKYDDQPPFGGYEKCMAAYFGTHPLGRSVLGTAQSVADLTPEAMRAYFQSRYSPGNMALVASGRVDFDRLVRSAEVYCGKWEPYEAPRQTPPAAPQSDFLSVQKEMATQEYVVQIGPAPAAEDDDRYAGRVLSTIVGDDSGSRYYWELIETGLAEFASLTTYEFQAAGITMSYLCCSPEQAARNLQRLRDIQQKAEQSGVTGDELEQAKCKICSNVVLRSERPGNRLFAVGSNWLQQRLYRSVKEVVDSYQAVTLQHAAAVLKKYPLSTNTTLVVGPLAEVAAPQ